MITRVLVYFRILLGGVTHVIGDNSFPFLSFPFLVVFWKTATAVTSLEGWSYELVGNNSGFEGEGGRGEGAKFELVGNRRYATLGEWSNVSSFFLKTFLLLLCFPIKKLHHKNAYKSKEAST